MENSPDLVLLNIFKFFNANELVNFKLVCKKWNFVIKKFLLKNLFVYEFKLISLQIQWPFSNSAIKNHELLDLIEIKNKSDLTLRKFEANLKNVVFLNLEKLFVYECCFSSFFLSNFNLFQNLKVLIFYFSSFIYQTDITVAINFPNLEFLKLEKSNVRNCLIVAPKLHTLVYWEYRTGNRLFEKSPIKFAHPKSIRFVESLYFYDEYLNFKNLERFVCLHFDRLETSNLFKELPNLKQLQLYPTNSTDKMIVKSLKKQANSLNLVNLQFLISGFNDESNLVMFSLDSTWNDYLDILYINEISQIRNLAKNYSKFINLPFNFRVYYNLFANNLFIDDKIPIDFFHKFLSIRQVIVDSNVNEQLLIQFLRSCKRIYALTINNCAFEQNFYNQLPEIEKIFELNLIENLKDIEFSFLYNLKNLEKFSLGYRGIPIDTLYQTFLKDRPNSFHDSFEFNFNLTIVNLRITILLNSKSIFLFLVNGQNVHYINVHDAFQFLREDERTMHYLV